MARTPLWWAAPLRRRLLLLLLLSSVACTSCECDATSDGAPTASGCGCSGDALRREPAAAAATATAARAASTDSSDAPEARSVPEATVPPALLIWVPPGEALLGHDDIDVSASTYHADGEGPMRRARLSGFYIGETAVSNREFGAFVAATSHQTDSERLGWSFVFEAHLTAMANATATESGKSHAHF